MPNRGHTRWSLLLVLALAALHALLTGYFAYARYATVHHHTFDLALYARLAWGLVHGQPWDPLLGGQGISGHAAWVLYPLGALGALFGTVPVLLAVQSVAVAAAALPLSSMAARRAGPVAGVLAAIAYLLQPNLGHVASYEFHPGTLALLPLSLALAAIDDEPTARAGRWLLWASAAAVACRAGVALQTAMLGVLLVASVPALRRQGAWLALSSFAYFAGWMLWSPATKDPASSQALHYAQWGGSPLGVFGVLLSEPGRVLAHLGAPQRLGYVGLVLAAVALLPLAAPRYLLVALPPLALNLLSAFPTASETYSHYLTLAVAPLLAAAIAGADRFGSSKRASRTLALAPFVVLCAAAATMHVRSGGLPWSRDFVAADFHVDADTRARRRVLDAIPRGASVQAPDPLLPHLAERVALHRAPPPERRAEFVVLDLSHRRRFAQREDLLRTVQEPMVRGWLARGDHRVVRVERDLLLLQRGSSPRGGLSRGYFAGRAPTGLDRLLTRCLGLRSAALHPREVVLTLVAQSNCPSDLALRIGVGHKPKRVDLPFDGVLSPAHLGAGDVLRSTHALTRAEHDAIARHGLRVGALRSSGARPEPRDPISVVAPLDVPAASP